MDETENKNGSGLPEQFSGPIDFLDQLQEEIKAVKDGTMEESRARVVAIFRRHQLKYAELHLMYQRMTKGKLPMKDIPLLSGSVQEKSTTKQS